MGPTKRIVVVGLGSIGRRHARLLSRRADVVCEVCEPSAASLERARPEIGPLTSHGDYAAVLASRPDAVLIATPHHLHADQAVAALEAGVHVLCEKPMAHSADAAQRMVDAAVTGRALLSIGFHLHFAPPIVRVRDLIRSGELGNVLHAHCRMGTYITLLNSLSRYQRDMPGALLFDYAHQPDVLNWWLGRRPLGVYAAGGQGGDLEHTSNPNYVASTIDYEDGLIATIHLNYVQMPQRHEYEVVGDKAWALVDLDAATVTIGDRVTQTCRVERLDAERDPHYVAEHQAFLDAIAGMRPVESPATEAMVSMRIIDATLRSLRERTRVAL
jgi:predicted dehydrogenase